MPTARALLLALAATLFAACDRFDTPESLMDEYLVRLGRVLDEEPVMQAIPPAPALPRRRDRVVHIPEYRVGLLSFLSLYGCELQHVVGERNSGLGKVMRPSSVLDYELRFIRAADACLPRLDDPELAGTVRDITALKRARIDRVAWNAVWGGEEIEALFTVAQGALPLAPNRDNLAAIATDLGSLAAVLDSVLNGETAADFAAHDPVFQRWLAIPAAGQTLRAASLLGARLEDATRIIQARLARKPLCFNGKRNPDSDTVHSMFMSVYVGNVQPYLAAVQRARQELLPPLQQLAAGRFDSGREWSTPAAMRAFYARALSETNDESVWRQLDAHIRHHTRAWQSLLEQCGLRPGSGGAQAPHVRTDATRSVR